MKIVPLTVPMLDFRTTEDNETEPDWFGPHITDLIGYNPDGCFALFDDRAIIGMVTTTFYRTIGWIGWLYVKNSARGHGYGERLMQRAIECLQEKGAGTVLLEAVVETVSLYRRLGFIEQFHTQHYRLMAGETKSSANDDIFVHDATAYSVSSIGEFDRRFFGQDRLTLLKRVMTNPNFEGFVAERAGRVAGMLFLTEAKNNRQVSPMIVDPDRDEGNVVSRTLTAAAFDRSDKPLYFRCPLVTSERCATLETLGAEKVAYHTVRMCLGQEYAPERAGVFSLGCPGKG